MSDIEKILAAVARHDAHHCVTWSEQCAFSVVVEPGLLHDDEALISLTAQDLPVFEKAMQDGGYGFGADLYVCRQVGQRPTERYYELLRREGGEENNRLYELFDACGPEP